MERDLAKVEAAGSSPVSRSKRNTKRWYPIGYHLFCVFEPRRDSKVRGLRFAPVVAKRTSTGCSAVSAPLRSLQSERPQDVLQSPLRSGRCKANVHRMFCSLRSKGNTKKQRKYIENLACFRYKDKNFAEKDKMLCFLSRL